MLQAAHVAGSPADPCQTDAAAGRQTTAWTLSRRIPIYFAELGARGARLQVRKSGIEKFYGYGTTKVVAVKQALEKCGNNKCRLVLAECE